MSATSEVREYYQQMGQAAPVECARALGIAPSTARRAVDSLFRRGWLKRVGDTRGLYEFCQLEPHQYGRAAELQKKIWRAVRMSPAFTVWDIAQLSGATIDYSKKYVSFLMKSGRVEKIGRDGQKAVYRAKGEASGIAPLMRTGKPKKELARQDLMELGWAMMRAIRDGKLHLTVGIHEEIGKKLQTV